MGNCLGIQFPYDKVKIINSAIKSLKFFRKENDSFIEKYKEKLAIEIDDAEEENRYYVSLDSSIEEVEIVDKSQEHQVKMVEKELWFSDSSVSTANEEVDGVEKMMEVMQLEQESCALKVPFRKKLYDLTNKREGKLNGLDLEIDYHSELCERFQKKTEQIKKVGFFILISMRMWLRNVLCLLLRRKRLWWLVLCLIPTGIILNLQLNYNSSVQLVSYAFGLFLLNFYRKKVLVSHENSNIDITGETLQCLRSGAWLNDEVINLYLELLKEREKREPQKFLKCHFFNTFFYKKLISGSGGYNFQSVRRWTTQRKLGYCLFECEKIFVPIHKEIHWCLAIINKKEKKFQYLDSLKGVDIQVLNVLAKYYVDEVKDKSGKDISVSSWEQEFVTRLPQQENGSDCGMFMIKYADFYSRDIGLCFNQGDMPYFRQMTAKEILKLRAE